jgi:hypothetical protein
MSDNLILWRSGFSDTGLKFNNHVQECFSESRTSSLRYF